MNGSYYSNPTFFDNSIEEDNRIENKGKIVKIYTNFREKEFSGRIEDFNPNNILISNPDKKEYYLIFNKNINYIESQEIIKTH